MNDNSNIDRDDLSSLDKIKDDWDAVEIRHSFKKIRKFKVKYFNFIGAAATIFSFAGFCFESEWLMQTYWAAILALAIANAAGAIRCWPRGASFLKRKHQALSKAIAKEESLRLDESLICFRFYYLGFFISLFISIPAI